MSPEDRDLVRERLEFRFGRNHNIEALVNDLDSLGFHRDEVNSDNERNYESWETSSLGNIKLETKDYDNRIEELKETLAMMCALSYAVSMELRAPVKPTPEKTRERILALYDYQCYAEKILISR